MSMKNQSLAIASALALMLGAGLAPLVGAQSGGGAVTNTLPTVETFSAAASPINEGITSTLSGDVKDRNKETDLVSLKLELVSGPAAFAASERAITSTDTSQTSDPGFGTDDWKVWNSGGASDGVMTFGFEYTYNTAGSYTWRISVKDEGAYQNNSALDVTVTVQEAIDVATDPVLADGTADTGATWGDWSAGLDATNIESTNFLKITNTGTDPTQPVTIDFSVSTFGGVTDAAETINIDNNIQFAIWEDTTPGTSSPQEGIDAGGFTYGSTSATGSVSDAFTGTGNIIYVKYQIGSLPPILKDQAYQQSFTVSAA